MTKKEPIVLTTGEFARRFGMSADVIKVLCRNGEIRARRQEGTHGKYLIPESEVAKFVRRKPGRQPKGER